MLTILHSGVRILFLTPELPFPAWGGGLIKSATLLAYMKPRYEVDVMCFRRSDLSKEQASWAAETGTMVTLQSLRRRTPVNLLRSVAAGVPLSILRNRSAGFAELVAQRLASGRYDAVFVDGWLMAQYLPKSFHGLRILHQHNAEHLMWQRQAASESHPLRRVLVGMESGRVRRYESSILRQFDVVFAVSEPDRRALQELDGELRVELLPNVPEPGMLDRPALSPPSGEPVVLFLGTLSWPPNLQGLRQFLQDALPLLRGRLPNAILVVGGRGTPAELARLAERVSGVELVGAFDDPEPLYRRARAFVELARGGSGTRVKVLNAMARGLPVVTTPDGAEGLDICPGEHALVGSTALEISDSLVHVLTNDSVWRMLAENGRRLVRERYTPEEAYRVLDGVFADRKR
jgi:glycosyltransferase involved in cell wall biosynthesis